MHSVREGEVSAPVGSPCGYPKGHMCVCVCVCVCRANIALDVCEHRKDSSTCEVGV